MPLSLLVALLRSRVLLRMLIAGCLVSLLLCIAAVTGIGPHLCLCLCHCLRPDLLSSPIPVLVDIVMLIFVPSYIPAVTNASMQTFVVGIITGVI